MLYASFFMVDINFTFIQVNENDFLLFDNVIHVDAGDNNLPFRKFNNLSFFVFSFNLLILLYQKLFDVIVIFVCKRELYF